MDTRKHFSFARLCISLASLLLICVMYLFYNINICEICYLLGNLFEILLLSHDSILSICYKLKMIPGKPLVVDRVLDWPPNFDLLGCLPCIISSPYDWVSPVNTMGYSSREKVIWRRWRDFADIIMIFKQLTLIKKEVFLVVPT